jgi:hypothetical protein
MAAERRIEMAILMRCTDFEVPKIIAKLTEKSPEY